ncbi:LOW QUALITY PROTEIN: guanine nucleotide exchange factor subunit RIC1-like [Hibiscus syriacus]|uniref:LOW QUALITY PROTEIN: guanine nucleotide exchange factor subunit RIC1-like n=1 Tax=Hibiscus syriacus TaxID=106335 RepID=UPI0019240BE1|nr:LOW QUALITY PROTEIN: guanine nucleotide exchange factor subunit RIC1-like [Hibiscus syriacus]
MYMAYGYPQVIPLEQGQYPTSQKIIYLKLINRLLLVVSPLHLELWSSSQHRVRLGSYKRDADSLKREGENLQAVWSPDTKLIAVLTSSLFLHIFKVQFTERKVQLGGKQPSGLFLAMITRVLNEQVPFAENNLAVSNIVSDNKHMLLGLSDGSLYSISWKGEFYGVFGLDSSQHNENEVATLSLSPVNFTASGEDDSSLASNNVSKKAAIAQLEFCVLMRLLLVLYSDGQLVSFTVSKKGLKAGESIKPEKNGNGDAVCTSVAGDQLILAVGTRRGVVELYDLADSGLLIRTLSLYDWGYTMEDTGSVSCIEWTPDNSAFAVGWKLRGLTVWSVSGCRLMSTIRQIGLSSASSPVVKTNQYCKYEPLMGGTSLMQWDEYGYRLYAIEEGSLERILSFSFGKCCLSRGVSGMTYVRQVIYGEDRLLVVQSEETDELKMLHLNLPVSYISHNWPVQHVAASKDGMYLAVAGLHGLILYDIRLKKWRVFGDISQEQKIQCKGLLWLGKIVVVFNYIDSSNMYELLFYPRYHLDQSSLLCRKPLLAKPMVMDVYEDYILVTYCPFDVHIFHVKLSGELTPSSTPDLQLSTVRELSIMTTKSHPAAMRFIPDQIPRDSALDNHNSSSSNLLAREPARCLILRTNGELSLLDLDDGRERELTNSVELFWVTCGQSEEKTNLIDDVSWLDYGYRGMQVWYPSSGVDSFKQEDFLQLDPDLEFDREVYPLGLLPNAGVVVGVSQRMSFSACTEFPCFEPTPQAQTILHCLLRHLLQRDKSEEALRLAKISAEKPHFSHCLEWLLFTVFDAEISRQNVNKNQVSVQKQNVSLLEKTCDLIRNFPEYLDVVVSVARKTDGRYWADLFTAAGRSTELFEDCFQRRWYRTAACYILVIAKLEGSAVSQYCALRLLQATLDESLYELAGELVRFLLRSGRDFEQSSTDSDKLSPRFLGYFLFRSSFSRSSLDKSPSVKDQSAHIASVKNILENHASYLMSGKELSKLVAFVKGTQFDLVEYLQRERYGSARLENFASGLELIGQKLQMGMLQSRLDAEFLLAHMCSVKFKEWIVVLATLLGRSEVLFDLFRHDMRLWKAYSMTLQSHPAFAEYHDLLDDLEKKLSTTANSEDK